MIRHCDGTDPNLIMYVDSATREKLDGIRRPGLSAMGRLAAAMGDQPYDVAPCDCGRTFDDVHRMTIWPHHAV